MRSDMPGRRAREEERVARALGRAGVYRLLGAAFACPAPERLEDLAERTTLASANPTTPPALREPLRRFARAARAAEFAALAAEYVSRFDGRVRCSPYEGAYGAARPLVGKSAELADIAGFYAAFGVGPSSARPDMEDHIAAELEFMSVLTLKEAWALGARHAEGLEITRRAEVAFLTDHLGRWAEAFARAVCQATTVAYYEAAAELLTAWIRREIAAVEATPRPWPEPSGPAAVGADGDAFTCPMSGVPRGGEAGPPSPAR